MYNRYSRWIFPQPMRKITPSFTDIPYTFRAFDNIDSLAQKYYGDVTMGWVIMCGNPQYEMEWLIKPGDDIRIPFPLQRVLNELGFEANS